MSYEKKTEIRENNWHDLSSWQRCPVCLITVHIQRTKQRSINLTYLRRGLQWLRPKLNTAMNTADRGRVETHTRRTQWTIQWNVVLCLHWTLQLLLSSPVKTVLTFKQLSSHLVSALYLQTPSCTPRHVRMCAWASECDLFTASLALDPVAWVLACRQAYIFQLKWEWEERRGGERSNISEHFPGSILIDTHTKGGRQ